MGGSKWDELVKSTEEDPFSEAAWDALLDCAEESGDNEKIKAAYDSLLQKYPNVVSNPSDRRSIVPRLRR